MHIFSESYPITSPTQAFQQLTPRQSVVPRLLMKSMWGNTCWNWYLVYALSKFSFSANRSKHFKRYASGNALGPHVKAPNFVRQL